MRKNFTVAAVVVCGMWLIAGCASTPKSDLSVMQGAWVGHEMDDSSGECRMTISGDALKFQGARDGEWYDARLILNPNTSPKQADVVIKNCSSPQYNTKTAKAIYTLVGKTLTIAVNEPGEDAVPSGFERSAANRARAFVFNKQ